MALTISLETTRFGLSLADTYARVMTVKSNKHEVKVLVHHFVDAAASDADALPVFDRIYRIPLADFPAGANPMAAAYEWMKQQPEYSSATDA